MQKMSGICPRVSGRQDRLGLILLKNSAFGQLNAFHRNTVPLTHLSENVACQRRVHKTLVLISGSVFPAGEFFNTIG